MFAFQQLLTFMYKHGSTMLPVTVPPLRLGVVLMSRKMQLLPTDAPSMEPLQLAKFAVLGLPGTPYSLAASEYKV